MSSIIKNLKVYFWSGFSESIALTTLLSSIFTLLFINTLVIFIYAIASYFIFNLIAVIINSILGIRIVLYMDRRHMTSERHLELVWMTKRSISARCFSSFPALFCYLSFYFTIKKYPHLQQTNPFQFYISTVAAIIIESFATVVLTAIFWKVFVKKLTSYSSLE